MIQGQLLNLKLVFVMASGVKWFSAEAGTLVSAQGEEPKITGVSVGINYHGKSNFNRNIHVGVLFCYITMTK